MMTEKQISELDKKVAVMDVKLEHALNPLIKQVELMAQVSTETQRSITELSTSIKSLVESTAITKKYVCDIDDRLDVIEKYVALDEADKARWDVPKRLLLGSIIAALVGGIGSAGWAVFELITNKG